MAFREVSGSNARDLKKEPVGTVVEGIYKGHRTFETQFGEQVVWNFTGKDGASFGIYGFTSLNRWLESVSIGTLTRITYQGKQVVDLPKRGKTPMHICKVEIDDESSDPTVDAPTFDPEAVPF